MIAGLGSILEKQSISSSIHIKLGSSSSTLTNLLRINKVDSGQENVFAIDLVWSVPFGLGPRVVFIVVGLALRYN